MESIKEIVNLSEGEQVVREYHAIEQYGIFKKLDGKLAFTNKRAIAYSKEKTVLGERVEINESDLEEIEGTKVISGFGVSLKLLIGGIAVAIIGIIMMVSGGIWILLLIVGIVLAIFSFRREFCVEVRSDSSGTGAPINYPFLLASGLVIAKVSGPDADALMKELGAMRRDIRLHGEKLLEKLKCPNPECRYMRPIDEKTPKHCPECGTNWGG